MVPMPRSGLALAACLALCSCRSPVYFPQAAPRLDGSWTLVWSSKPGPLVIEGCRSEYTQFTFQQKGEAVTVQAYDVKPGASYDSLRVYAGSLEQARLRARGGRQSQAADADEVLDLQWEPASGHWAGTLDSQAIRLAPLDRRYPPEPCPDI